MKKLLIVVDFQNDFVTGALGFDRAPALEAPIATKISEYRREGQTVAFTFDTHGQDYLQTREGTNLPVVHCLRDSEGWQLFGSIAGMVEPGDKLIYKPAFGSAELFDYLRTSDFESVELVGLVSDICVISNAVLAKAALPEAEVIVDAACTSTADPEKNEAALDVMSGMQIKIINR